MKTTLLLISLAAFPAFAQSNSLLACVEKESLEINTDCVTKTIELNEKFIASQNLVSANAKKSFENGMSDLSDKVMSKIEYYPNENLIVVTASSEI